MIVSAKIEIMFVSAKIAEFQFETALDLFFRDNPKWAVSKESIERELRTYGEAVCWRWRSHDFDVKCVLTLIKE
jgi:hypothetical protein